MTLEEINRTLVAAEGGCWHESFDNWFECRKCGMDTEGLENPDFSKWENFGRLLKIAVKIQYERVDTKLEGCITHLITDLFDKTVTADQIPLLVNRTCKDTKGGKMKHFIPHLLLLAGTAKP